MAIAPLERRIDQAAEALDQIDQNKQIAETQPELPPPDMPAPEEFPAEPVQVAGPMTAIRKALRRSAATPRVEPVMDAEAAAVAEQRDAVKAATNLGIADQPTATIAVQTEQAARARPGMTPEAVAAQRQDVADLRVTTPPEMEKPDITRFNLNVMDTPESVKTTVETISRMLDLKVDRITFDDVVASATKAGMDQGFINRLTSGKLVVNPENTYRAMNVMVASAAKLDGYMEKIARGTASADERAEAAQWIHFHSVLQESV
ncbi:MAG TPA: hypothetical protein VLA31_01945, partial [Burkholderiaceae bacterium]|nr:hypothetical protein [Burkholderiaceae bacterium]